VSDPGGRIIDLDSAHNTTVSLAAGCINLSVHAHGCEATSCGGHIRCGSPSVLRHVVCRHAVQEFARIIKPANRINLIPDAWACFEAISIPCDEASFLFQSPFDERRNSQENTVPGSTTSPSMRSPSSETTKVMFSGGPCRPFNVVW
jgi:hypothetical protein